MDFLELVERVSKELPNVKRLEVEVAAKVDDAGKWTVTYKVDSIYMTAASARSPEALLMKIAADKIPPVEIDGVGKVSTAARND